MFKISDKVVCVDDSNQNNPFTYGPSQDVIKGNIYVVRDFIPADCTYDADGVRLVGITAGLWFDGEEAGFRADRFRKLEDIKEENRKKQQEPHPV